MAIRNTTLGTAPAQIYASSNTSAISLMYFCNVSSGSQTFTVHAVPAGGTASIANVIYYNVQISPTDTFVVDTERLILDHGDSVVAVASQDSTIVATVSYVGV